MGRRLVALGFVLMIVTGNIWLVYRLGGKAEPPWLVGLGQASLLFLLMAVIIYFLGKLRKNFF